MKEDTKEYVNHLLALDKILTDRILNEIEEAIRLDGIRERDKKSLWKV